MNIDLEFDLNSCDSVPSQSNTLLECAPQTCIHRRLAT